MIEGQVVQLQLVEGGEAGVKGLVSETARELRDEIQTGAVGSDGELPRTQEKRSGVRRPDCGEQMERGKLVDQQGDQWAGDRRRLEKR